jgi:hypothetical protein
VTDEQAFGEKLLVVGHVMKWSREKDFLKVISCLILSPFFAVATFLCHFRVFVRCLANFDPHLPLCNHSQIRGFSVSGSRILRSHLNLVI